MSSELLHQVFFGLLVIENLNKDDPWRRGEELCVPGLLGLRDELTPPQSSLQRFQTKGESNRYYYH